MPSTVRIRRQAQLRTFRSSSCQDLLAICDHRLQGHLDGPCPVVTPAIQARKGASMCILSDSTAPVRPDAATVERTADLTIACKGC
ncbi:hypothetical protein LJR066_006671 [Acidovorax sp. LjRoot66]|uniref:hypothetical protein n=1 Tax=Acidovorax sp. LjRoot66 TaxID=3342334 RepID=UPI003ED02A01